MVGLKEGLARAWWAQTTARAKAAVTGWINIRGDDVGPLLYRIRKGGKVIPVRLTDQAIWVVLEKRFKAAKIKAFTPINATV